MKKRKTFQEWLKENNLLEAFEINKINPNEDQTEKRLRYKERLIKLKAITKKELLKRGLLNLANQVDNFDFNLNDLNNKWKYLPITHDEEGNPLI